MTTNFDAPPAAPRVSLGNVPHVHPPKVELFDVAAMTNTDPKGLVRAVDLYRREDFGLYLARAVEGHRELAYLRSWLLPELGLRVSRWCRHAGRRRKEDFYVDLVEIDPDHGTRIGAPGPVWRVVDHYLDITVRTGLDLEVLDTDELLAALRAGLITPDAAQRALERTYLAVDGIARQGYDLERWLAQHDIRLTWPRPEPPAETRF